MGDLHVGVRSGGRYHGTRRMVGVGDQCGWKLLRGAGGLHGFVLGFDRRAYPLNPLMVFVLKNFPNTFLEINVKLKKVCKSANGSFV